MKRLSLLEMQDMEYDILCCVADLCEQNNLRYSLCGGTLLGAVRHGGFIPWDDDIDIAMPRSDYMKFLELETQLPQYYRLSSPYKDFNNFNTYSKVYDMRTKLIEAPKDKKIKSHVYIDIFPMDGIPDNPIKQERHRRSIKYRTLILYALKAAKYKANVSKGVRKAAWNIIDQIQKKFVKNRFIYFVDKAALKYEFDSSRYVSIIVAGYGFREFMPGIVMEYNNTVKFRDRTFSAFRMPEYYLTNLYGDFMRLPPVEKRTRHDNIAYRI